MIDRKIQKIRNGLFKVIFFKNPNKYAEIIGVKIGENSRLVDHPIWGTEPWLISIGTHTLISSEVEFITHDGCTWIFREENEASPLMKFGKISIGNNTFIGTRSILLPGVTVGNNSVVAAGSVVSKSIPDNEVWGGVPAHFIKRTDELKNSIVASMPEYNMELFKKDKKKEILRHIL